MTARTRATAARRGREGVALVVFVVTALVLLRALAAPAAAVVVDPHSVGVGNWVDAADHADFAETSAQTDALGAVSAAATFSHGVTEPDKAMEVTPTRRTRRAAGVAMALVATIVAATSAAVVATQRRRGGERGVRLESVSQRLLPVRGPPLGHAI